MSRLLVAASTSLHQPCCSRPHLDEVDELVAGLVVVDAAPHHLLAHVQVNLAGGAAHVPAQAGQETPRGQRAGTLENAVPQAYAAALSGVVRRAVQLPSVELLRAGVSQERSRVPLRWGPPPALTQSRRRPSLPGR